MIITTVKRTQMTSMGMTLALLREISPTILSPLSRSLHIFPFGMPRPTSQGSSDWDGHRLTLELFTSGESMCDTTDDVAVINSVRSREFRFRLCSGGTCQECPTAREYHSVEA